jgi:hypothetical protein
MLWVYRNPTLTGSRYGFMLPDRKEPYSGLSLSKPLDMAVTLIRAQSNP